ncbi:hypothetical protein BsWGS_13910 [Bradybaena similaris]
MRHSLEPMLLCLLFFMCWSFSSSPGLVSARQRARSRLSLWIDEAQVKTLTGYELEIKIISNGEVTPYVHNPDLFAKIVIPAEIDTVNLTWQAGPDIYSYFFDDFVSLDQHLLYQPLLGIPARGYIPRFRTEFQITIPCKGKERGVASLVLGLKIFDHLRRPLDGTPIHFRLKKQCMAFVTSALCQQECKNGGTCNPHGVCECPPGFKGPLCDKALCTPACQNNGTCISPSTCACPAGFHGNLCEKAMCGRACQNGGHCLPEGFCWCAQGFYGDACEYSHCIPMCSNGGTCTGTNQCLCSAEYSGNLCEIKEDTERPRRSKEPDTYRLNKDSKKTPARSLELKLQKAEQRLLKITFRRAPTWDIPEDEIRTLRRLKNKADKESLSLQERRYLIKFLTQERRHLNSKDKTKLKRFKNLIRQSKKRQKLRKRRLYVK